MLPCRYSAWDYRRIDVPAAGSKQRKLHVSLGDVPLHLRGGTIVPMQLQPAMVARDVRLSPITLVVALPASAASTQGEGGAIGGGAGSSPVPAYALEEVCNAARASNSDKLVACGYVFMDGGDELTVTTDNSIQVGWSGFNPCPAGWQHVQYTQACIVEGSRLQHCRVGSNPDGRLATTWQNIAIADLSTVCRLGFHVCQLAPYPSWSVLVYPLSPCTAGVVHGGGVARWHLRHHQQLSDIKHRPGLWPAAR